jgi:hypothetical protein
MRARTILSAIAVPALASAIALVPAVDANAVTTRSDLNFSTSVTVTAGGLQICASATFTGSLFDNTTISLDIAGVDEAGGNANPIAAAPISTDFTPSQTVCSNFVLQTGSTLHVDYSAEAVGLSPTPFTGNCVGSVTRTNGGTPLVEKTC